jgi:hypothetical protein
MDQDEQTDAGGAAVPFTPGEPDADGPAIPLTQALVDDACGIDLAGIAYECAMTGKCGKRRGTMNKAKRQERKWRKQQQKLRLQWYDDPESMADEWMGRKQVDGGYTRFDWLKAAFYSWLENSKRHDGVAGDNYSDDVAPWRGLTRDELTALQDMHWEAFCRELGRQLNENARIEHEMGWD